MRKETIAIGELIKSMDELVAAFKSCCPVGGTDTGTGKTWGRSSSRVAVVSGGVRPCRFPRGRSAHAGGPGGHGGAGDALAARWRRLPPLSPLASVLRLHMTTIRQQHDAVILDFQAVQRDTEATQTNTGAVNANTAAVKSAATTHLLGSIIGAVGSILGGPLGGMLGTALGGGHALGGVVNETGLAKIHGGEVIASQTVMENVSKGLQGMSLKNLRATQRVMENIGRGLPERMPDMRGVAQQLAATQPKFSGGDNVVSFDGATFHGVPDRRYVGSIMETPSGSYGRAAVPGPSTPRATRVLAG